MDPATALEHIAESLKKYPELFAKYTPARRRMLVHIVKYIERKIEPPAKQHSGILGELRSRETD